MDLATLALFAAALFVNAGSPGPGILALVARVTADGLRPVLPILLAFWLGELLWLVAAVLGLSALALAFHKAFVVLKWLGVAYLLFLAWRMWTRPVGGPADLPRGESAWATFLAGMALTLGNPKIMIFYVALLPSLIDLDAVTPLGARGAGRDRAPRHDDRGPWMGLRRCLGPPLAQDASGTAPCQSGRGHCHGRGRGGDRHALRDAQGRITVGTEITVFVGER